MSTPAQTDNANLLVVRLLEAHSDSQQRVIGSDIFWEAATTIRLLIENEAERYRRNQKLKTKLVSVRELVFDDSIDAPDTILLLKEALRDE